MTAEELLTPRQIDVLRGLADGLSFREIGLRLRLGTATCSHTAIDAYRRLGVATAAGAVGEAYRRGILRVDGVHVQGVGGCRG